MKVVNNASLAHLASSTSDPHCKPAGVKKGESTLTSANVETGSKTGSSCCGIKKGLKAIATFFGCMKNYPKIQKQIEAIVDFRENHWNDKGADKSYANLINDLPKTVKNELRELAWKYYAYGELNESESEEVSSDLSVPFSEALKDGEQMKPVHEWVQSKKNDKSIITEIENNLFVVTDMESASEVFKMYLTQLKEINSEKPAAAAPEKVAKGSKNAESSFIRFIRFITCGLCYKAEDEKAKG